MEHMCEFKDLGTDDDCGVVSHSLVLVLRGGQEAHAIRSLRLQVSAAPPLGYGRWRHPTESLLGREPLLSMIFRIVPLVMGTCFGFTRIGHP